MTDTTNPLSKLLTSESKGINLETIATFLENFVKFDEATQDIVFLRDFHKVDSNDAKIKIVLITSKAKNLLFNIDEGMSPTEIINLEIMPVGSVKSTLKRLSDSHVARKNKSGKYFIPNYSIDEVINSLKARS